MRATIKKGERIFLLLYIYVGCLSCVPVKAEQNLQVQELVEVQPAPLLPSHPPVCARQVCAEKSVSPEPCRLSPSQLKYIGFVSSSSLASTYYVFFPHTYTSLMPSIMSSSFHIFLVFISSPSFLAFYQHLLLIPLPPAQSKPL